MTSALRDRFRVVAALCLCVSALTACSGAGKAASPPAASATIGLAARIAAPSAMAKFCKTELFAARYAAAINTVDVGLTTAPVEQVMDDARAWFAAGDSRYAALTAMMRAAAQNSAHETLTVAPTSSQQLATLVNTHDAVDVDACTSQFDPADAAPAPAPSPVTRESRRAAPTTIATPSAHPAAGPTCIASFAAVIDSVRHADYGQQYAIDAAPDAASRTLLDRALTTMTTTINTSMTISTADAVAQAVDTMRPYCATHPQARAHQP